MILKRFIAFTKRFEDPKNPLLGPTLKALYFCGLWLTGSKFRTNLYYGLHFFTFLFVCSQFIDLYVVRHDINKVINNMSLTVLSVICFAKCCSYVMWQKDWKELVRSVSEEEINHMKNQDISVQKLMKEYKNYTRIITNLFWLMVLGTNILLILTPFLKYLTSPNYREEIKVGQEPLPQIISCWLPFDTNKIPGYLIAIFIQTVMGFQGSGIIAGYDMNAVAIMSYLNGQMIILMEKCKKIFAEPLTANDALDRIKECHRHHTVLIKHYRMFNSLLSPTMFLYVLLCSITICASVVQFSSKKASTSQKLWIIEYTGGLVSQLFLYCWHSNEVRIQSFKVDRGVYYSNWWRGDVRVQRQLILLAGKLNQPMILAAGPYTSLSISTFISIIKGSYSFYTLFSQIQNDSI